MEAVRLSKKNKQVKKRMEQLARLLEEEFSDENFITQKEFEKSQRNSKDSSDSNRKRTRR